MDINQDKKKTCELIKVRRLEKGYSQQELADLAKINIRSVQRIENAEVLPRMYTLKILAGILDIRYENLLSTQVALGKQQHEVINKANRLIISVSSAVVFILLMAAFLSQSSRFPETSFELFLLLAGVFAVYTILLIYIWK